jgi:phosphomannomutase
MTLGQPTDDYYRFCPGEEQIKLSNAICRARQKTHFPKCRGCPFNDDAARGNAPRVADKAQTNSMLESIFHHDDVRALVPDPLSTDVAWRIGHATAQYLRGKLRGYERADHNARALVVGRDTRPHSHTLQQALISGIRAYGVDVIDVGIIDTAQLHFAVSHIGACGGIQTTAGHLPAAFNGFRFCAAKGIAIGIDTGLASIRDIAARVPKHDTGASASVTETDLSALYANFIRGFLVGDGKLPRPLKVVVDASNGAAGRWLPIVLGKIRNLTLFPLNFQHEGAFAHDPDPSAPRSIKELRNLVRQHRADMGICFDSDLGRCALIDERGTVVPADVMAALIARRLLEREPQAAIVFDLRSTASLAEEVERAGGVPVRARTDRPSIKKAMSEHNAIFGCDLSGCFFFRDSLLCQSALLAFVHLLNLMATADRTLSELVRPIQRYRSSGELTFACPEPDQALKRIAAAHHDARIDDLDGITVRYADWWFNLRRAPAESALRLVVQARTKKVVEQRLGDLSPLLTFGTMADSVRGAQPAE